MGKFGHKQQGKLSPREQARLDANNKRRNTLWNDHPGPPTHERVPLFHISHIELASIIASVSTKAELIKKTALIFQALNTGFRLPDYEELCDQKTRGRTGDDQES